MKRFFFSTLFCVSLSAFAGTTEYNGEQAGQLVTGSSQVIINNDRHSISFVRLQENFFVAESGHLDWVKQILHLPLMEDLQLIRAENDQVGFTHYRYKQVYKNVPVEWGTVIVHAKAGRVVTFNTEYYSNINLDVSTSLSESEALNIAKARLKSQQFSTIQTDPVKVVVFPAGNSFHIAYKTDVYSEVPLNRSFIYVDAKSGAVLRELSRIHFTDVIGTAVTRYSGTRNITTDSVSAGNYRLRETGRGGGVQTLDLNQGFDYLTAVDFTDADNFWNTTTNYDDAAYDCHLGTEGTYDYFWNRYGRNSYDDLGAPLLSYVHYGTGFVNAFWDGSRMTYGDGDGVDWFPLTSTEVTGHEVTHGVTEHSSGLIYADESGALNESFSDIFGVAIDFTVNPTTANWLMGDSFSATGDAFRSMSDPNLYNNPDTYGGLYWVPGQDVHYNSGVQNHWYYILSMGDVGTNDLGDSYSVIGIGIDVAADVSYRNNNFYLTPSSTYADARTGAVQAAIDLFGNCSNEVIQTTNAWYAVGVGGIFSNAVVANFSTAANYYCVVPATVQFTNTSVNSTSWAWDFGDGGTSTSQNPSHTYNVAGDYTITLIANGIAACGNSDTIIQLNYIHVTNGGGPVSASCSPSTVSYCCNYGVFNLQFNTINNTSLSGVEGYKDFTCSHSTNLTAGDPYPIQVTTSQGQQEDVSVWIDYDNNGAFNQTNELVFTSTDTRFHNGIIHTPISATLNTPLRMRVTSDNASSNINSGCFSSQNGQTEDYTVEFQANTLPPAADFVADDTVVNTGQTVNFTDLTIHAPTGWTWFFAGGTPSTSTSQNPSVVYNVLGTYQVTLVATNSFGSDSIIKTGYIHVVNEYIMCTQTTAVSPSGVLFDSGGPTGPYQDNENCSFLIDPGCASSITLTFSSFVLESGWDYLRVYDGPNTTSPLLMNSTGSTIPSSVTANSGVMLVVFTSDFSVIMAGFEASWTSVIPPQVPPVANFSISDANPPLLVPVDFTDLSTINPIQWLWDFGDGGTSTLQDPSHAYSASGSFTIRLITWNCTSSDTLDQSILVQLAPELIVIPDTIEVTLSCSDSITVPIHVINGGGGELVFNVNGGGSSNTLEVLALTYGTDMSTEYPNTIAALNQYFTNYSLDTTNTTDGNYLATRLTGKDILLIPEPELGIPSVYLNYATALNNFVSNGGAVVICGTYGAQAACVFNTGLLSGTYGINVNNYNIDVLDPGHPIMQNVPDPFVAANATDGYLFTSPNLTTLADYIGNSVVAVRDLGDGKVVFLGMDYFTFGNDQARLIGNSFSWIQSTATPDWLEVPDVSDTLGVGDTTTFYITINAANLNGGTYTAPVVVYSNDPNHLTDTVWVILHVDFQPCAGFTTSTTTCSGIVCFTDASTNSPTSWGWNFGDGNTSTQQNPCHTYTVAGNYTIMHSVCNGNGCDTIYQNIFISNIGGPAAASCTPGTTNNCCGIGMVLVQFNTITNSSVDGSVGYEDFTCTDQTNVDAGDSYTISVTTGNAYQEIVKAWIDYNNSGTFDATEEVMNSTALINHTATITIPTNTVQNTPLRFRLGSDYYTSTVPDPCIASYYGQFEDYSVTVLDPTLVNDNNHANAIISVYPNPFSDQTVVSYQLLKSSSVKIELYNLLGDLVQVISENEKQSAGHYSAAIRSGDPGIYMLKVKTGDQLTVKRIVNIR